jgi:hypothetical protein
MLETVQAQQLMLSRVQKWLAHQSMHTTDKQCVNNIITASVHAHWMHRARPQLRRMHLLLRLLL